jgi:hypothetical protein
MAIRTGLFVMNAYGAVSNARESFKYSVDFCQAIHNQDPWNAAFAAAGAVMHGGLAWMNVLGMKGFLGSLKTPPPAAAIGVGGSAVSQMWRLVFTNPSVKKWVVEEFLPVAGTSLGMFVSMGHEVDWEVRDSDGNIKSSGAEESGTDGAGSGRLDWNEQLQTHSEWKLLAELSGVEKGDIITIRGELPPCNPGGRGCFATMNAYAKRNQVQIIYIIPGHSWVFPQ